MESGGAVEMMLREEKPRAFLFGGSLNPVSGMSRALTLAQLAYGAGYIAEYTCLLTRMLAAGAAPVSWRV